ncbi:MAG: hypothetical protein ABIO70_00355 [Pseudomonadota bacterium]
MMSCRGDDGPPSPADDSAPPAADTADSAPETSLLTGRVELWTAIGQGENLTTVCDLTVDLEGTPTMAPCDDCLLDLDVQAEVARDVGLSVCQPSPLLTWLPSGAYRDLRLAWAPSAEVAPWGAVSNALLAGYALVDAGFEQAGPTWSAVVFDGHPSASATWQEGTLAWSYEEEVFTVAPRALSVCSFVHTSLATLALGGVYTAESGLDCAGEVMDVWSFEAQGQVDLTVDTLSAGDSADLLLIVNDAATTCTLAVADDNFACSFPPLTGGCPAMRVELGAGGSYHAVVMSTGACTGDLVRYRLRLDATTDPGLTLAEDDAFVYVVDAKTVIQVQGQVTLALDGPGGDPLTRAASGSMGPSPVR